MEVYLIIKIRGWGGFRASRSGVLLFWKSVKRIENKGKEANEVCWWDRPGNSSSIKCVKAGQATAWLTTGFTYGPISAETGCFQTSPPHRAVNEDMHRCFLKSLTAGRGVQSVQYYFISLFIPGYCFLFFFLFLEKKNQTNIWMCSSPNSTTVTLQLDSIIENWSFPSAAEMNLWCRSASFFLGAENKSVLQLYNYPENHTLNQPGWKHPSWKDRLNPCHLGAKRIL